MKFIGLILVALVIASCGGEVSPEQIEAPIADVSTVVDELIDETELDEELDGVDSLSETEEDWIMPMIDLCQTNFGVYISDPGEAFTNVRNSPAGSVIMELRHGKVMEEYMLDIILVKDGWCKFEGPILGIDEDFEIPGGFGWVHHSVVATDTRNYGNQVISLYEFPEESSSVTGTIEQESGGLKILDACGDWVLIELSYDDYYRKGWMKTEWCCGNPLTTCS